MKNRIKILSSFLAVIIFSTFFIGDFSAAVNEKYMVKEDDVKNKALSYASYDFIYKKVVTDYDDKPSTTSYFTKQYNFADSDLIYYFKDSSGNLNAVVANCSPRLKYMKYNCIINIYSFDKDYNLIKKTNLNTPSEFDKFGGFYHGTDGYNYVVIGRDNKSQSTKKVVIKVIKYSEDFSETLGVCDVLGGISSNGKKGIYEVFSGGTCRMSNSGNNLTVYTSRTAFSKTSTHHQLSIAIHINTKNMDIISYNSPYMSHSFNCFVNKESSYKYYLDHGDAYSSRGMVLTTYKGKEIKTLTLFKMRGKAGDNYTGSTIGGMEVSNSRLLVVGTSVPHDNAVRGVTGSSSKYKKNIYLVKATKDGKKKAFKWLTKRDVRGNVYFESPRLVKLNGSRFVVMFNKIEGKKRTLVCMTLDSKGNVLKTKSYGNMYFADNSDPIYYNGQIVWISPASDNINTTSNYLYHIPYSELK